MAIQGSGYELVGVSLLGGPLTEPVHIELDNDLTAFYGENGAGKTWLLRLMSSALTGVALRTVEGETTPLADMHLRPNPVSPLPAGTFLDELTSVLWSTAHAGHGVFLQTYDEEVDGSPIMHAGKCRERDRSPDFLGQIIRDLVDVSRATHGAPLDMGPALYESGEKRTLTLRACGSAQLPQWKVFLAGPVHDGEIVPDLLREVSKEWFRVQTADDAKDSNLPDGPEEGTDEWFREQSEGAWPTLNVIEWASASRYFPVLPRGRGQTTYRAPHEGWPDWLQVPILPICQVSVSAVQVLGSDERPREPDADTLAHILRAGSITIDPDGRETDPPAVVVGSDSQAPVFNDSIANALDGVQRETAANLQDVLPGSPTMRFHMGTIEEWLRGIRPAWQFEAASTGEWLPITMLSSAQLRWVELAIGLACAPGNDLPVVFFCDEPEMGLHRLAERRLAAGLRSLALRTGVSVLAATHSPLLLDANHARPVLVRRGPHGAVATSPVPLSVVDRLAAEHSAGQLGLSVGDLLPLMRLAIVVEGLHDELVFASLLREPIDNAVASILPLHGGKRARSVAEARLLFDGTDAQVLLVLDNLEHKQVHEIWTSTTSLAAAGEVDAARACLDGLDRSKSSERLFLHQLGVRALEVGRMDRIHVHGLSLPDVICYLPPDLLLQKAKPWSELLDSWERNSAPKPPTNLKGWLKTNHFLPLDEEQLNAAVQTAAIMASREGLPVHTDLVNLGLHIQSLRSDWTSWEAGSSGTV